MTKTYGLTHLAIAVRDVETTLKFYTHIFDMEVMYHQEKMIQLTTPDNHDILVFEEKDDANIGMSGGIAHFGFRLRDPKAMKDIHQKILEAGGEVVDQGDFVPGSPYIFFKDPDGYLLEVWYELLSNEQE